MPACKNCSVSFEIAPEDEKFYEKVGVPHPTHCPECRLQRRLAFRNERNLYHRKCDLTGKQIISTYSSGKPYKVYAPAEWWSDKLDGTEYGRDFDFSRPFFEQFAELQRAVPRMSMIVTHCENCDYAPYSVNSKNSYMCVSLTEAEDIFYSYQIHFSRNCLDCNLCWHCEFCYECFYCTRLFQSAFCQHCENSNDLYFCQDCRSCSNCIGCKNLVNKKYHIFNKAVSPEKFLEIKQSLRNHSDLQKIIKKANYFFSTLPQRGAYIINCENTTGDNLQNCKNIRYCFDSANLEDCAYVYNIPKGAKDCQDINYTPCAELVYEGMSVVNDYNAKFVLHSWDNKDSSYIDECFYSHDLFGCIGLKKNQYCILNKQYSKEEYEKLVPRIIKHMQRIGEWGEYFPIEISPFAYNESIAQEYYPLTKEEAQERDWRWKDEEEHVSYDGPPVSIPDSISEVSDSICQQVLTCEISDRNYKIIPQELEFYRKMGLPIPHRCPDQRYRDRMGLRNPRKLWIRKCAKCEANIQTTYAPTRPETVYCEACYLKEIY